MLPVHQQRNYFNNMADVNKSKLQLRSSLSFNGDKTPSPATKLLINHGKPNFTIQKSPKVLNGNASANPLSPTPSAANASNEFVVKSTTFNGVFKPSNLSAATKQTLQQNGTTSNGGGNDNEASKVVLRRTKIVLDELREGDNENVPEFIRRQRRIQERLANQNILDFENRRSGYFTHVMISPTNPNRQSFVETMASPAVKPGLEIPPPPSQQENIPEEITQAKPLTLNGQNEEEDIAKAIEEVNKAVEGEDDDKIELEEHVENTQQQIEQEQLIQPTVATKITVEKVEEAQPEAEQNQTETPAVAVVTSAVVEETPLKETPVIAAVTSAVVEETPIVETPIVAAVVTSVLEEAVATTSALIENNAEEPKTNGVVAEQHQNGHTNGEALDNEITISHTNGIHNGPSLPSPDPKGEKGVNFEPKTVVSFSQELGNNVNKYPDTVKVAKDGQTPDVDDELRELTKLKFEINADANDIEVKPVLITETA